jgi:2-isopropylmalate synthase
MREVFGYHVKSISDHAHSELQPSEVYDIFMRDFVNLDGDVKIKRAQYLEHLGSVDAVVEVEYLGKSYEIRTSGNGRLDCVSNAIKEATGIDYSLDTYTQHALEDKSSARAASYVSIALDGKYYWGCGIDSDISTSSTKALISAVNKLISKQ